MAFKALERSWMVDVRQMTEAAATQMLQRAAQSEIARVQSQQAARSGGITPDLAALVVDGNRGATISQIGHNSRVMLDWNYLAEAVIRTVEYLETHGPHLKGEWKDSIITLIEGAEIGRGAPIPRLASQAVVAVTAPYARRLEVGKRKGGGPFVLQVKQHFVEKACLFLNRQHGDLAKFSFTYVNLSGGRRQLSFKGRRGRRPTMDAHERKAAAAVAFPAIRIVEVQAI